MKASLLLSKIVAQLNLSNSTKLCNSTLGDSRSLYTTDIHVEPTTATCGSRLIFVYYRRRSFDASVSIVENRLRVSELNLKFLKGLLMKFYEFCEFLCKRQDLIDNGALLSLLQPD